MEQRCYNAWRRSESYCVPVTEEGMKMAEERYREFRKGYYAGLRASIFELEQMHKENKMIHRFYLFASEALRRLLK